MILNVTISLILKKKKSKLIFLAVEIISLTEYWDIYKISRKIIYILGWQESNCVFLKGIY